MTLETMQAVTEDLKQRGISATLEYPGFIAISRENGCAMHWGDAGDTLGCDIVDADQQVIESAGEWFDSSIPRDSADAKRIADHIACSYTEWMEA